MLFIITTVLIFFVYKLKGSLANSTCDIQWFLCPFTNSSQDNVYRNNEELITEYLQSNCQTLIRLGTVLASIIQTNISEVSDTLYYDQNLASIPDIFVEGKEYYTYWYIGQFVSPQYCSSIQKNDNGEIDISLLRFRGINYSPEFYFNGVTLSDPSVPSSGMFHPYTLNISPYLKNDDVLNSISVLVHPPAYLGSALDGGQGGDHEIARNGAVMQCTLGWDWIQATPDRNTGIWDRVDLTSSGYVTIENSYMFTDSIQFDTYSATVIAESTLVNRHPTETMKGIWRIIILSDRGDLVATTEVLSVEVFPGSSRLMVSAPIQISGVTLWWPHTHGLPYLYTVQISFTLDAHSTPSHSIEFKHGVRTVTGYIDSVTKGWAFKVNNVSIFLVGGNWIATDQLVRYSNGDELSQRRYRQEVGLHA